MQKTQSNKESLRNKMRENIRPVRSSDTSKRAVCGNAIVNGNNVVLITTVTPNERDTTYMLDKTLFSEMELFDTFGDKVNQLKNDGYEIDYRFDKVIKFNI